MSEYAGKVLGVGEILEFEGATYQLSPFGYSMRGKFEAWCKMQARREVNDYKELLEQRAISLL